MTTLMRHDPVNRLPIFSRPMSHWFENPFTFETSLSNTVNDPAVTVYETADEYVFCAEVPGWRRDQLVINFENQRLTISGRRELEEGEGRQYHRVEGFYGQFRRSLTVAGSVDFNGVEAELRDGILSVQLPKREEAKPRQIEVKTVQ